MPLRRRLYTSSPAAFTPDVFVPDPPAWTEVAHDYFERTETDGWGTSDQGGAWTVENGTASTFAVNSGVAKMTYSATGTKAMKWGTLSKRDVRVVMRWRWTKVPATSSVLSGVGVRGSGGYNGTLYRLRASIAAGGAINLQAHKIVAGTETSLANESTGLTLVSSADYTMRCIVSGATPTTIQMRVWNAAESEPDTWLVDVEDSEATLQDAGNVFTRFTVSGGLTNLPIEARIAHILLDELA